MDKAAANKLAAQIKMAEINGVMGALIESEIVKIASDEDYAIIAEAIAERLPEDWDLETMLAAIDEVMTNYDELMAGDAAATEALAAEAAGKEAADKEAAEATAKKAEEEKVAAEKAATDKAAETETAAETKQPTPEPAEAEAEKAQAKAEAETKSKSEEVSKEEAKEACEVPTEQEVMASYGQLTLSKQAGEISDENYEKIAASIMDLLKAIKGYPAGLADAAKNYKHQMGLMGSMGKARAADAMKGQGASRQSALRDLLGLGKGMARETGAMAAKAAPAAAVAGAGGIGLKALLARQQ